MEKVCVSCSKVLHQNAKHKKCWSCSSSLRMCACGKEHKSRHKSCVSCRYPTTKLDKCKCGNSKTKRSNDCISCLEPRILGRRRSDYTEEEFRSLLISNIDSGLSLARMADKFGTAVAYLQKYCKKLGIKTKFSTGELRPGPAPKEAYTKCISCGNGIQAAKKFCNVECQRDYKVEQYKKWCNSLFYVTSREIPDYFRRFLKEEQSNKCAICYKLNVWEGKDLVLIMDHVDGNSENNVRSNIRFVCPNCDTQLPTYCGRNKGNGRHHRRVRYDKGNYYL